MVCLLSLYKRNAVPVKPCKLVIAITTFHPKNVTVIMTFLVLGRLLLCIWMIQWPWYSLWLPSILFEKVACFSNLTWQTTGKLLCGSLFDRNWASSRFGFLWSLFGWHINLKYYKGMEKKRISHTEVVQSCRWQALSAVWRTRNPSAHHQLSTLFLLCISSLMLS